MRALIRLVVDLCAAAVGLPAIVAGAVASLRPGSRRRPPQKPRVLWGSQPIKALAWMAETARRAGYESEVVVRELYAIYPPEHFDHIVSEYVAYYHERRPHQGIGNVRLTPPRGEPEEATAGECPRVR